MMTVKHIIGMWCTLGVIIWAGMVIIIMLFMRGSKATINKSKDENKKEQDHNGVQDNLRD